MYKKGAKLQELMRYCYRNKIAMTYFNTSARIFISITSSRNGKYSNQNGTNLNKVIEATWTDIKRIRI